jgi:hypothetical protein
MIPQVTTVLAIGKTTLPTVSDPAGGANTGVSIAIEMKVVLI